MAKFQLNNYPYHYVCPKCSYEFYITEEQEAYWKDGYDLFDDEPLAFECEICKDGIAKPVGYVAPGKYEPFIVFLPPTEEEMKEWDELFGPLER